MEFSFAFTFSKYRLEKYFIEGIIKKQYVKMMNNWFLSCIYPLRPTFFLIFVLKIGERLAAKDKYS